MAHDNVAGRRAEVTPYDFQDRSAAGCTDELRRFEHMTTLVFQNPGTSEVVLRYSTNELHNADGRKVFTVEVSPAG